MAGLTDDGLVIKTTDEILGEINEQQQADINPGLNLSSATPLGQINGITAAKLGEIWDVLRAVHMSMYPASASGRSLDNVCSFTGTKRHDAVKSQLAAVVVNLDDGFSAAAGELIASVAGDPTRRFVNVDAVENTSGITDDFDVNFEAETAGAVPCLAGQLTVIAESLSGWNSVTNPTDAIEGDPIDSDPVLRLRREQELAGGSTTPDAIRSDILKNDDLGVTFCRVLSNERDVTDSNGLPPHSFEVIARGPDSPTDEDNEALCDQILASKPGGIQAYGSASKTRTDAQGNEYSIGYTRPTIKDTYLEIDVEVNDNYPADGDDQIAAALVAVGDDNYQPGDDVIAERLKAAVFMVVGVTDVSALRLGFSASPSGTTNLAIGIREIAALDTSRVLVTQV